MKRTVIFVNMILAVLTFNATAQPKPQSGYKVPVTVIGNDTLPVFVMDDVQVEEKLDTEELYKQKEWRKMLYDVMKVYPYAQDCAERLNAIEAQMAAMDSKKDRKKFLKEEEQKLKEQYEEKLKDLNYRQGKLLVKLIDRQTGRSSYSLIKDYKSGMQAMFWQGFAGMFGMSLKEKYDPAKEVQIEQIIKHLGFK